MFSKATSSFVRQVDPEGSLIHVSRMNDSSKLLPMALVVKRKRVWFWQRPKYQPTDFKLGDLLLGDKKLTPVVSKREFLDYTGNFGDKISGKLDAEAGSVGLTLEGLGSSKLLSDFGSLQKEELNVVKLLEDSNKRLVDMDHVLVQQLEKRSDVLAIVKERILTSAACTVTETKKEQCAFRAVVGLLGELVANMKVCIKEHNDIDTDSDVSLTIPADVVIAYSVLELEIKKDGHYNICLCPGSIGGGFEADTVSSWCSQEDLDVTDGRCLDENIPEQPQENGSQVEDFSPLAELSQATRWALFCKLQVILRDRVTLTHLQRALEAECVSATPDATQQEELTGGPTKLPDSVDSAPPPLNAAHLLVSALEELPDETLNLLSDSQPGFFEAFSGLMSLLPESNRPVCIQSLPTPLWEKEAFQRAEELLSTVGATLTVDGDRLCLETGGKNEVRVLVLRLSAYGLSLLCSGQKQDIPPYFV
ncbi:gasdermin-E-like [Syngnathoides biaculeatus]|uniref:gasdermin-E-like n=1 Tax=Syngnathoides biaculeatus TaxID=300417 RepID=UPI002ADE26D8|nr:gasdermin-E-like [Syngnathoides biaculeatus]